MTQFKNTWLGKELSAAGAYISVLWTALHPSLEEGVKQVAIAVGTTALAAGVAAKDAGGSYGDVRDAVEKAALDSVKTVGVTVGTQELETLTTLATHVATTPDDPGAPPPQDGTAA